MKNVFTKELKFYRKNIFFWSLGILFLLLASMAKYQGYVDSGVSVAELFNSLPAGFAAVFGISNIDLQSAAGFYAVVALYVAVMLGIQAVLLGSSIVAKEETDKTAEFLFTKPVARTKALAAKLLASITIVVIISSLTLIVSVLVVGAFNKGASVSGEIIFLAPAILAIQLVFLIIGFTFAAVLKRPKHAVQFAAMVLLATFVLSVFVDIDERFNFLKYLTPFKYFDVKTIYIDNSYNLVFITLAILLSILFLVFSFVRFRNRDLNI